VPGHAQIEGNETADQAAKKGAAMDSPPAHRYSFASLKRRAKANTMSALQSYWQSTAPQSYQDLQITASPQCPAELRLPRPLLARILAARSGHGDFARYHERFNHEDAYLLCRCGSKKTPIHFFFCRIARRRLPRPPGPPSEMIPYLLGTPKGAAELASWFSQARFFDDICPRYPQRQTA
jgi:hypothetical protein